MTDERIIAYLLRELPEDELEQFEDECFAQQSWPSQLETVEEDLIDAYLRNELIAKRRERFERNYLTTEARKERVVMAAALLRHIDESDLPARAVAAGPAAPHWTERFRYFWSSQSPALRAGMALLVISVIAGFLWLYLPQRPSQRTFAQLTLYSSLGNRAEGTQAAAVKLPRGVEALKVSLMLPEGSPAEARYRVLLLSNDGETRPYEIAGQDNQSISVVIPASQLKRGQYAFQLFMLNAYGAEQRVGGNYFFTIE